tara:strand:+ start:199 stop:1005 length:807 start_codon:yes stop_codon:yes gene_type:complete
LSDLLTFSNNGITNYLVLLTVAVFLIAGMVKGSIGMGLPLISITLLSFYTSPRLAMMLIIVPTLVTNFLQFYRSVDRLNIVISNKFLLVSLFVCTLTSSFFSFSLEQKTLSFLLGLIIFIFVIYRRSGFSPSFGLEYDKVLQIGSGAIIGTVAGFTHVWAPTIAVLLVIRKANKEQFVALTGLFIFVGSSGLFFTHYHFDLLDRQSLIFSTLMIFPSIVGFLIGEKIRSFISEKLFDTLLMFFLLIASTNLLYKSDFITHFMKASGKS